MAKKSTVPDAWDDDWELQADKAESIAEASREEANFTKAERLAKHAETNRKIWQNAEEPETFHFLAARDNIPLQSEFKPALKVLSRKPAPKLVERVDPISGLAKMTEDEDEDGEETKISPSPEEMRLRAQRDREEKQKRYDEVRARIMGTALGNPSPGTITPPNEGRGRGRARINSRHESSRFSSLSGSKDLLDPNFTPRPGCSIEKHSRTVTAREDDQTVRAPKGPEGRGFGFANKRGKPV